jgi:hypothetical protein
VGAFHVTVAWGLVGLAVVYVGPVVATPVGWPGVVKGVVKVVPGAEAPAGFTPTTVMV